MAEKNHASGTRKTTEYLRGLAIVGVLVSHYRINFSGGSELFEGYGNAIVALFFILSGYGNFYSLRKLAGQRARTGPRFVATFFRHRAIRIYPEYWLALALTFWAFGRDITLPDILGLKSIYWFIHSIIQCYLAAPLLYYGLLRLGARKLFFVTTLVFVLANATKFLILDAFPVFSPPDVLLFRELVFANIYIFCLGMFLPAALSNIKDRIHKRYGKYFLLLYLVVVVINGVSAYGYDFSRGVLLISATFGICLALLSAPYDLPGGQILRILGRSSYQIYLFEPFYYYVLATFGIIVNGMQGLVPYLACFPAFLAACMLMNRGLSFLLRR